MVSCAQIETGKSSQGTTNNNASANSANKAYDLILVPNPIDLLYFHKSGRKKNKADKRKSCIRDSPLHQSFPSLFLLVKL